MKIIGIMSGTSLDGVDVALCEVNGAPPHLNAEILRAATVPYPPELRARLLDLCAPGRVDELARLNFELGEFIAKAIQAVLGATLAQADLIASHGQTVWHDVDQNGRVTATLQIGSAAVIAERCGLTTINNFRERDLSAGGAGAPLTAYVDWLLLRHPEKWRAVQNIGGIANVSFLPPLSDENTPLLAFDTGPGNVLIDAAMSLITNGAQTYDAGGEMAASGMIQREWLAELLRHPYFEQKPPRTTGRELFGAAMARELLKVGTERGYSHADIIATLTAFTAESIAAAYAAFAPAPPQEIIIGGGGAHNQTLLRWLGELLSPAQVLRHEDIGLDSDFKEALVFAVLAHETWHHRVGTLAEQTGARHSSILGQITPAANYAALLRRTGLI